MKKFALIGLVILLVAVGLVVGCAKKPSPIQGTIKEVQISGDQQTVTLIPTNDPEQVIVQVTPDTQILVNEKECGIFDLQSAVAQGPVTVTVTPNPSNPAIADCVDAATRK